MKKILCLFLLTMIILLGGCGNTDKAEMDPAAQIESSSFDWPRLIIRAPMYPRCVPIQGATYWAVPYGDGTYKVTSNDSPHPLQLTQAHFWPESTISLRFTTSEIEFEFNEPPLTVSVVRWRMSDITAFNADSQEAGATAAYYEIVEATADGFTITDDGYSYIYEVRAIWAQGSSAFAFRVIPLPTEL